MKKDYLNKKFCLTLVFLFACFIVFPIYCSAKDYFLMPGESTTANKYDITLKSISNGKALFEIDSNNVIAEVGNPEKYENVKILINKIAKATKFDEEQTVFFSVCKKDAEEICNSLDDNCNGEIDEGVERACGLGAGICKKGTQKCIDGEWGYCGAQTPQTEICNGLDDDCDGEIDNNITIRACGSGKGICQGVQICMAGTWSTCPAKMPTREICNGLDDDCDGKIDNELEHCNADEIKIAVENTQAENEFTKQPEKSTQTTKKKTSTKSTADKSKSTTADDTASDDSNAISGNAVKEKQTVSETTKENTEEPKGFFARFWAWLIGIV